MTNKSKYELLINNTLLISIGTFGSKILTFLMTRFYTEALTPSDYGEADLIIQTANLLIPLVSAGIADGVFRFVLETDDEHTAKRKSIFSAGFYTISAGTAILAALSSFISIPGFLSEYKWLLIWFISASCYHSLCAQFIRGEGKTRLFAYQGVLNTVLVIVFSILFLSVFEAGTSGYIISIALADSICALYLAAGQKLWRLMDIHLKPGMWRKMMRYSLPLVPAALFWWITSVSDRYMITWFLGSGANGIYTVASKIPAIITLISGMFLEAWQFSAVRESRGSRRSYISFYTNIWSMFLTVMFIGGSIIIAFSPAAIRLLAASEYYSAAEYLPILTAAAILSSLVSFMGSVYIVTKRSSLSFLTTAAGAVFNIILNFLLIPTHLGIYGAAIATLCSYLLSFLIRIISIRNILPFRIYGGRLFMSILIIAVQIISSSWDGHLNTGIQLSCFLSLAAINIHPLIAYVKSSRL
ncbi:polysaccharide biosynthesis C-terminal domain-containing protein [Casaltella massiliensis]|nr:polysaccharide biosynthesis C-terminal domain-containing protein [Casaltella massiliensis]